MEEGHVTVDGVTHGVPRPFMVIATQNPIEQAGTYRLPEAQLDRFLMKTSVGYPDAESTEELLLSSRIRDRARPGRRRWSTADDRAEMSAHRRRGATSTARLVRYVRRLAEASPRARRTCGSACRARGCLALVRVAKTWAAADGRAHVVPAGRGHAGHARALPPAAPATPRPCSRGVTVDDVVAAVARPRPWPALRPRA